MSVQPPRLVLTRSVSAGRGIVVLTVAGELDLATKDQLAAEVAGVLAQPDLARLLLDFGPLAFIDSSGIAALVAARRTALTRGVRLTVTNCGDFAQRVLTITGLYQELTE